MKMRMLGLLAVAIAGCSTQSTREVRMIQAPAREANCALDFVQVDITRIDFNSTWDVVGYVNLYGHSQDPMAEDNRKEVRTRACRMGGTSVGVAINSPGTMWGASTGGISYMVLRPKAPPAAPTAF